MKQNSIYSNSTKILFAAALVLAAALVIVSFIGCGNSTGSQSLKEKAVTRENIISNDSTGVIFFAGGCFWGTEHFFKQVDGVTATEVGFANGHSENPTYDDVIRKETGYAETVKVTYNPKKVDLSLLLDLYFLTVDPTSLNKQGNDIGNQYRTGIYWTTDQQEPFVKERVKAESAKHSEPVVVEAIPLKIYYKAEAYHQAYLDNNPGGYCHINPALFKVAKAANKKK